MGRHDPKMRDTSELCVGVGAEVSVLASREGVGHPREGKTCDIQAVTGGPLPRFELGTHPATS